MALENTHELYPGRVQVHQGSWLEPLQGKFRLIVSNPPYVAANDPHLTRGDCRFEPTAALSPGADPLAAIRRIANDAGPFLESGGMLAFEHGFEQGEDVRALLGRLGYREIETRKDLEDRDRVTSAIRA